MESKAETQLRAQLRQAEEALGTLMGDVKEAAKDLDDRAEDLDLCADVSAESLWAICDALMAARDRANNAWAAWKREEPR